MSAHFASCIYSNSAVSVKTDCPRWIRMRIMFGSKSASILVVTFCYLNLIAVGKHRFFYFIFFFICYFVLKLSVACGFGGYFWIVCIKCEYRLLCLQRRLIDNRCACDFYYVSECSRVHRNSFLFVYVFPQRLFICPFWSILLWRLPDQRYRLRRI